jgi:hypothetical protein
MREPNGPQVLMENLHFFAWLLGAILTSAITLLGIYLRLFVKNALNDHSEALHTMIASNYVRRDVYEADVRTLRAIIEGSRE